MDEIRGHVWEGLRCPHANHVLQKCVLISRPEAQRPQRRIAIWAQDQNRVAPRPPHAGARVVCGRRWQPHRYDPVSGCAPTGGHRLDGCGGRLSSFRGAAIAAAGWLPCPPTRATAAGAPTLRLAALRADVAATEAPRHHRRDSGEIGFGRSSSRAAGVDLTTQCRRSGGGVVSASSGVEQASPLRRWRRPHTHPP